LRLKIKICGEKELGEEQIEFKIQDSSSRIQGSGLLFVNDFYSCIGMRRDIGIITEAS
jgi:hypothetical protein